MKYKQAFKFIPWYETHDYVTTRCLANPNWGCGHFSHNFWKSYDYVIDDQGEGSCAYWMAI